MSRKSLSMITEAEWLASLDPFERSAALHESGGSVTWTAREVAENAALASQEKFEKRRQRGRIDTEMPLPQSE